MVMYLGDFCFNIDIFYCLKSKLLQCCNILILNVNTADFGERGPESDATGTCNVPCVIMLHFDILCISFRLFQGGKGGTNSVKTEKLQAIFHYFRRITKESK